MLSLAPSLPVHPISRSEPIRVAVFGTDFGTARTVGRMLEFDHRVSVSLAIELKQLDTQLDQSVAFDIALVDIDHSEIVPTEIIKTLNQRYPTRSIVAFSKRDSIELIENIINAGAVGFIVEGDLSCDQIVTKLQELKKGWPALCPRIIKQLFETVRTAHTEAHLCPAIAGDAHAASQEVMLEKLADLSEREREILRLGAQGMVNRQIAEALHLSPHTVTTHFKNIYRKLEVHTRGEAVFKAQSAGLI